MCWMVMPQEICKKVEEISKNKGKKSQLIHNFLSFVYSFGP
jgi:hypothetical protein